MNEQTIMEILIGLRDDHYLDSRRMLRKLGDEHRIYQRAEARWCVLQDALDEIENEGGPPSPPPGDTDNTTIRMHRNAYGQ
jgi:hypothetical protein